MTGAGISLKTTQVALASVWMAVVAVAVAAPPAAAVPLLMPTQGVVADNAGTIIAAGAFEMTFALYAAEAGEDAVWTETWTTQAAGGCAEDPEGCVVVSGGVFAVELGRHAPLSPDVFAGASELWLGVAVEGDPELPRRALGSAGFAFHAGSAADLACSGCVDADALSDATRAALRDEALQAVEDAGYLKPGSIGISEADLPSNGLDEVSNGLLSNQFTHTFEAPGVPTPIPDNNPVDFLTHLMVVPDVGIAETIRVWVHIENSDVDSLDIELEGPGGQVYVLVVATDPDGGPTVLDTSYPDLSPTLTGDLEFDWIGMNAAGPWTLRVVDDFYLTNAFDGELVSWGVEVSVISNTTVAVIGDLEITGSVTGAGLNIDGDIDLHSHRILNGRFQMANSAPVPCDAAHQGFFYVSPDDKSLQICLGDEFMRVGIDSCGDGVRQPSEGCDDGDLEADDGCNSVCAIENGWICEGAPTSTCTTICGDGLRSGPETCDDGDQDPNDGCDGDCQEELGWQCVGAINSDCNTICGDGIHVSGEEECDDGNDVDDDDCSNTCTSTHVCSGIDQAPLKRISIPELNQCLAANGAAFSNVQFIEIAYGNTEYLTNVCNSFGYGAYAGVPNEGDFCSSSANMYPSHCGQGWLGGACGNGCGNTNHLAFFCQ